METGWSYREGPLWLVWRVAWGRAEAGGTLAGGWRWKEHPTTGRCQSLLLDSVRGTRGTLSESRDTPGPRFPHLCDEGSGFVSKVARVRYSTAEGPAAPLVASASGTPSLGYCIECSKALGSRERALPQPALRTDRCVLPSLQVQCHSYTGYCWCVTPNGRPISGTAVAHKTPRCPGRSGLMTG